MKTVEISMFKMAVMTGALCAIETIIFFIVSHYFGNERVVQVMFLGAVALSVASALARALSVAVALSVTLALAGAGALAVTVAGEGSGALAVTLALAGAGALAVTVAEEGAVGETIFSLFKIFVFFMLTTIFMIIGVFMILKNIPMGMFTVSFACLFPVLVSGCDLVLQYNGEKGLFAKKEEVAQTQSS